MAIEKANFCFQPKGIDDINEFNKKIIEWIVWYNTKRYHWSLNLMSPVDYLLNNNMVSNMRWANTYEVFSNCKMS